MAATSRRTLGRNLSTDSTAFFLCDMQEKFKPHIKFFAEILEVAQRMVCASKILSIPLFVTEQYPNGLGKTVEDLDVTSAVDVYPKTVFSMLIPEVQRELETRRNIKSIVLFGIETHVCIQQTALDLLGKDYDVHVVADACSSRSMMDRQFAYERLRQAGAIVTTSESVLLQLVGDKNHAHFKEIQGVIKVSAPTSGL
ncbi:isochorismatase domain-containing protein 1-like [Antedon mediterranea]|uniref:isochorismatase domain-containing protein 1-like n=1 Tax=Antedon mediterranea TaxID=105859 RepID=UPI003AF817AA